MFTIDLKDVYNRFKICLAGYFRNFLNLNGKINCNVYMFSKWSWIIAQENYIK